jgi:dipeptidyl aminopeptidase/acylaminoacyl peptidase
MKRMLPWLLLAPILWLAGCSDGDSNRGSSSIDLAQEDTGEMPPLLDRELFFGDPEISGSNLSPDGRYVSFLKPYRDVRNVWIKGIDEPFSAARPLTADDRPVPGYFWSRDSRYVLYVQDKGGNEDFHVYSVDPDAAAVAETGVPPAVDLTPIEGVRARIYSVPKERPDVIIVGLNDRDPAYHDVYQIDIATGERKLLISNDQNVGAYVFDLSGQPRLALRQIEGGDTALLRVESDGSLVEIMRCNYEESIDPIRFTPDGRRCYLSTNMGEDVDLSRLMLLDPATGELEFVESDPERQVDFGAAIFDQRTDELILTVYVGDRQRLYPHEDAMARDLEIMRNKLPEGELFVNGITEDMNLMLVGVTRDVDPGSVYLYDRRTGEIELQYRSRPDLPSEQLAPMKAFRYKARDGLEIPAYLTLPRGKPVENLPVVVLPHGGPWARDGWGYDPYAQFLANRGYAVFQMNFRGSTGYGKHFLNAGNREWGIGAMQNDITDGVRFLVEKGWADAERIGIFGGSYGGYATLAGVTFTPELYACGIPYVAPSNLITLVESFPAYWRPWLEGSWFKRVGDPEVEADRLDMIERSPLFKADQIQCPLLVVHGANDPRVKQHESDQIVVALRSKGKDVEYIVAPDEGHGFRAPLNRKALAVAMERFLAKHLGGRLQEDVRPETADRLEMITVDVSQVEAPDNSSGGEG